MSTNGQEQAASTSAVATPQGKVVQVPDLVVPTNRIYNFVERYRKTYFEDHGLEWCLDEIITRGIAEITRQVKTAAKAAENRAFGDMGRQFNMTPKQAAEFLKTALAKQAADAAAANAKKA